MGMDAHGKVASECGHFDGEDAFGNEFAGAHAYDANTKYAPGVRIEQFFERTGRDYERFNYLGEWHSHPSFEARPSGRDEQSMYDIINDRAVGAEFAVLLIVKIGALSTMEVSATIFVPGHAPVAASLLRGNELRDG